MLRVLRGTDPRRVALELDVDIDVLQRWVDQFIAGGTARLVHGADATRERQTDRLLQLAAHELRTPISVLRGWLGVLSDPDLDVSTERQGRERLAATVSRLEDLIDDLLATTTAALGRSDLRRTVLDLAATVEEVAETDGSLEVRHDGRPVEVLADPEATRRAIVRTIAGVRSGDATARVIIRMRRTPRWGEVSVTRDGVIIPFETVHAMLEPFDLKTERRAPTLGPYLARALVVAMDGHLGADVTDGSTRFWIRLPREEPRTT